jgi:hypothetical protein
MKHNLFTLVIIASVLFLFSCGSSNRVASNEEFIKTEVDKILKQLPIKIDEITTWSDVQPGTDEVNFIYDVKGIDADAVNDDMISEARSKIISSLKTQTDLWPIFKRNISIKYSFYDENEYEIMQATVTRNDLGI